VRLSGLKTPGSDVTGQTDEAFLVTARGCTVTSDGGRTSGVRGVWARPWPRPPEQRAVGDTPHPVDAVLQVASGRAGLSHALPGLAALATLTALEQR
jgi:hypothetical protein